MDVLDYLERHLQEEIESETVIVMTGGCDYQAYTRHTARVEAYNTVLALIAKARRDTGQEFEPREEDFSVGS